ncbi:MAG TPA: type II toxin-antitoxin system VapC family toxin [Thermoanaerobaculia bacterium]|nr:type II toxin-antitoxin system VapC family toxin [Thermoanaerobaculia bacterium]
MRAVDTNVLVRLLTRDDPKQLAAAEEFVRAGAWVSHLVLMEAAWVLDSVYSVKADQIAAGVEMLLDHRDLAVQDADVVTAALSLYRRRPALGFSDCLILEVARKAGHVPLGTFDRGLGKLEGAQKLEPLG